VSRNIFRECEVRLEVGGQQVENYLKQDKLNCSDKTDSIFSADAGFICGAAPVTAVVLWDVIKRTSCIYTFLLFEIVTT
jgi:hypothetical protein